MEILFRYIPIRRQYGSYKGVSEKVVKKRLVSRGWEVWRGNCIGILRREDIFHNVRKKYTRLRMLLSEELYESLCYVNAVHHGIPDYVCFRDRLLFVECKLGHEQLSIRQKKCIKRLVERGVDVEVHKLVFYETKIRKAIVTKIRQRQPISKENNVCLT